MGRYTVVQARRACEDSMLGRRDTIEGCCQMLLKFPIDPATSKASLYTSVPQVCPDLPRRRAKADNVKTHVCASRPLPELRNTSQKLQLSLLQNTG